jgi:hypothetical protein
MIAKILILLLIELVTASAQVSHSKPFTVLIRNNFDISFLVYRVDDPRNPVFINETKPGSTITFNSLTQTEIAIVSKDSFFFTEFLVGEAPLATSNKTVLANQFQWFPITETVINFPGNFTFNTTLENDNSTTTVQPFKVVIDNLFYISVHIFLINDPLNPVYVTTIWAYYSFALDTYTTWQYAIVDANNLQLYTNFTIGKSDFSTTNLTVSLEVFQHWLPINGSDINFPWNKKMTNPIEPFTIRIKNPPGGFVFSVNDPFKPILVDEMSPISSWVYRTYTTWKFAIVSKDLQTYTSFVVGEGKFTDSDLAVTVSNSRSDWLPVTDGKLNFSFVNSDVRPFKMGLNNSFPQSAQLFEINEDLNARWFGQMGEGSVTWFVGFTTWEFAIVTEDTRWFGTFTVGEGLFNESSAVVNTESLPMAPLRWADIYFPFVVDKFTANLTATTFKATKIPTTTRKALTTTNKPTTTTTKLTTTTTKQTTTTNKLTTTKPTTTTTKPTTTTTKQTTTTTKQTTTTTKPTITTTKLTTTTTKLTTTTTKPITRATKPTTTTTKPKTTKIKLTP